MDFQRGSQRPADLPGCHGRSNEQQADPAANQRGWIRSLGNHRLNRRSLRAGKRAAVEPWGLSDYRLQQHHGIRLFNGGVAGARGRLESEPNDIPTFADVVGGAQQPGGFSYRLAGVLDGEPDWHDLGMLGPATGSTLRSRFRAARLWTEPVSSLSLFRDEEAAPVATAIRRRAGPGGRHGRAIPGPHPGAGVARAQPPFPRRPIVGSRESGRAADHRQPDNRILDQTGRFQQPPKPAMPKPMAAKAR